MEAGYSERVIGTIASGYRVASSLTTGQISLPGGDTYLITSDVEGSDAREILHFESERFAEAGYTGSRFLEMRSERGAARIQGISISTLGMIITVEEEDVITLLLIEGPFDANRVQRFMEY